MRYETKIADALLFGRDRPVRTRACDCPGCDAAGDYRAPKSRDLTDYYWFCLDHVRDYNLNWDYYAGMNQAAIEAHIRNDACWQRETWPLGGMRRAEAAVKDKVEREFFGDGEEAPNPAASAMRRHIPAAIVAALAVLELQPPADFTRIKAQYKLLVKQHHPDANAGSKAAEARFKDINQAFATLKKTYEMELAG